MLLFWRNKGTDGSHNDLNTSVLILMDKSTMLIVALADAVDDMNCCVGIFPGTDSSMGLYVLGLIQ